MSAEGPTGPSWMEDAPVSQAGFTRTGVASKKPSGIPSVVFFGLIIVVVAVAGIVGISIWGPEKEVKNRSHLATDPPAPTELPSLPPDPSATPEPSAAAAPVEAAPTETAPAPEPAAKPKRKGGKKGRPPQ